MSETLPRFTLRDVFKLIESALKSQVAHYRNAIRATADLADFAVPYGCRECEVTAKFARDGYGDLHVECPLCRAVEDFDVAAEMAEHHHARQVFEDFPVELEEFLKLRGDSLDDIPVSTFVFLGDTTNFAKPPIGFD